MPEEDSDWAVVGVDEGAGGVGDQTIMELSADEERSWRGLGFELESSV